MKQEFTFHWKWGWWAADIASVHLSSLGAKENLEALPATWQGIQVTIEVPGW